MYLYIISVFLKLFLSMGLNSPIARLLIPHFGQNHRTKDIHNLKPGSQPMMVGRAEQSRAVCGGSVHEAEQASESRARTKSQSPTAAG